MSEVLIIKEPEDSCSSYYDTAKVIAKCKYPVGSTEWYDEVYAIIKKYGHQEKLDTYERLSLNMEELDKPWAQQFLIEIVQGKIETHKDFANRPLDMQIFGKGSWLK